MDETKDKRQEPMTTTSRDGCYARDIECASIQLAELGHNANAPILNLVGNRQCRKEELMETSFMHEKSAWNMRSDTVLL